MPRRQASASPPDAPASSGPPVASLRGLGPQSAALLASVGIHTAAQLRAQDPFAVYARLKRVAGAGVSLNMLYALIGAVEDRDWRDIARERKTEILLRLDDMGLAPR